MYASFLFRQPRGGVCASDCGRLFPKFIQFAMRYSASRSINTCKEPAMDAIHRWVVGARSEPAGRGKSSVVARCIFIGTHRQAGHHTCLLCASLVLGRNPPEGIQRPVTVALKRKPTLNPASRQHALSLNCLSAPLGYRCCITVADIVLPKTSAKCFVLHACSDEQLISMSGGRCLTGVSPP